jgi:quercetin dioxygenase-like cupin family protein
MRPPLTTGRTRLKRSVLFFCALFTVFAAEKTSTLIDNDQVRVLNVVMRPHEKTHFHQHNVNCVMIYLQAGIQNFHSMAGEKSVSAFRSGDVKWSPAGAMDVAELTSNRPVNVIEVELKKQVLGTQALGRVNVLDPAKIDSAHYKMEFENDQVRVLRVKYGPRDIAPMHQHTLNRVVVYLTDQESSVTDIDGKVKAARHKAGEVGWGTAAKHTEQNLGETPFEVIVVEPKS